MPSHQNSTEARILHDGVILHLRDRIHRERLSLLSHQRQLRLSIHRQLRDLAEHGKIAVIESGRDCDGVRYDGHRCVIDATMRAYDKLYEIVANSADGPFAFCLAKPSEHVEYTSRDLALEAFENGHPHCLYD